jgi:small-conductance mechanosensitive channel
MSFDVLALLESRLRDMIAGALTLTPQIAAALAIVALTWAGARIARWAAEGAARRMRARRGLSEVFRMLANVGVWGAGLLIAAMVAFPTVTPGKALTALGLGSIAIGFAFKDVFENFLAGLLILIRQPFEIGDHVEADGVEGQVEAISVRDTRIRQTDGQLVVTPNARLFQNPVTVRTSQELRRASIICGVAYGEDVDAARDVIEQAVRAVDSVRDDVRDVQVFACAFGASSLDFEVAWWTGSRPVDIRRSRDQVVSAIKRALDSAGIEIPFPYRTLTLKGPVPVTMRDGAE